MRAFEYSGSLMKVGRSSKKWITRWYVLKNYTMLIYNSKSSSEPKRKQTLSKINSILFRYHFPQRSLLRKMQRERWPFRHSLVLRGKFQILAKMDVPQGCGLGWRVDAILKSALSILPGRGHFLRSPKTRRRSFCRGLWSQAQVFGPNLRCQENGQIQAYSKGEHILEKRASNREYDPPSLHHRN